MSVTVARTDILPAIRGVAEIRIVTMTDGSVALHQAEQTITLHKYHAAEIAGFLWPADVKPLFKN